MKRMASAIIDKPFATRQEVGALIGAAAISGRSPQ